MIGADEYILCVGVGGMGMTPLALYLRAAGACVWGYDDALSTRARTLLKRGGVFLLDVPELPEACTEVVLSSAISLEHPLCAAARKAGISITLRGACLARVLKSKKVVAIVGSHGKTTTAALLVTALKSKNIAFSYVSGGLFRSDVWAPSHFDASSEWAIAEVDESDGTIEHFSPEITLAVNFDWDHVAYYPTQEALERAFGVLFRRTQRSILIPSGDALLSRLAQGSGKHVATFGVGGCFDATITSAGFAKGSLQLKEPHAVPLLELPAGGHYNGVNALAALGGVSLMGIDLTGVCLKAYPGISRRQDILWRDSTLSVVTDYAHHPSELDVIFQSLKSETGPLTVVFQPHRYTRTQHLAASFAEVLKAGDSVHLLPVYAASEAPIKGGTSQAIVDAGSWSEKSISLWELGDFDKLKKELLSQKSGIVAFLGAGDIELFAQAFVEDLTAQALASALSEDTYFAQHEPLAKKTTLRVGGNARYYAEPASEDDLVALLKATYSLNVPVFMLGRGSNVIVSDNGFAGLVLRLNHPHWRAVKQFSDGKILAGAGVRLKEICGFASKQGLAGFEFLEGIPATLGGALRMNAGAMGGWMFDVVESVTWVNAQGEVEHTNKEAFDVSYRQCKELLNGVALSAVLEPSSKEGSSVIKEIMQGYASSRKASQPREPSAGCIFKNAQESPAGKLVDELGLKGLSRGNAEVSSAHGNFIINKGGATSKDVLGLAREVHDHVRKQTGIVLEPEVLLLGECWEDVLA